MSMEEKHGAIWITVEEDDSAKIIFEEYLINLNKIHVIFRRANGSFTPYSYIQKSDYQYRLPIWSQENEKAIMPTIESAKGYLLNYGEKHT